MTNRGVMMLVGLPLLYFGGVLVRQGLDQCVGCNETKIIGGCIAAILGGIVFFASFSEDT